MAIIYEIDLTLISTSETYDVSINKSLYDGIAERFKIPHVHEVSMKANLTSQNDLWVLSGSVYATVQLECIQSKELFDATFNVPFHVLLSHHEIEDDMADVEVLKGTKVDIGEIAIQYLALEVPFNPIHPKVETQFSDVYLPVERETPEWKKALEKLKSQK